MPTPNTPHWTVRRSLNKEHSISQITGWIVIIVNYGEIPLLIITLITRGPLILHTYIICLFLVLCLHSPMQVYLILQLDSFHSLSVPPTCMD